MIASPKILILHKNKIAVLDFIFFILSTLHIFCLKIYQFHFYMTDQVFFFFIFVFLFKFSYPDW